MQILLDIIGASVLAGMVIMSVVQMNGTMTDAAFQTTLDKITQENAKTISDMINHDFYKIGYRDTLDPVDPVVVAADSGRITFRSDIDNDGVVDTVSYYTADHVDSLDGGGRIFKRLYRTVNSSSPGDGARLGLTTFRLTYYDGDGMPLALTSPTADTMGRSRIKSIRVEMFVRNQVVVDAASGGGFDPTFSAVYLEKFISPKNLRTLK